MSGTRLIILIFSFAALLSDIILLVGFRKHRAPPCGLRVFVFEKYFYLGAVVRRILHVSSKPYKMRLRKLSELYDEHDAVRIALAATNAPYTYAALSLPLIAITFVFSKNRIFSLLILVLFFFMCIYFDLWLNSRIKNRNESILSEFSSVIFKIYVLVSIGVPSTQAFEKVAGSSDGFLYQEMTRVVNDVSLGVSYSDALEAFRGRCSCKEVRKFISVYKQNLILGGPDFPVLLNEMVDNAFSSRKERAKLMGNMASQKLLFPTMLMFIGVLIMVIVPSFENIFI